MKVDLVADLGTSCAARGLRKAHGAAPVTHRALIVSPRWIEEAGGLHDPKNPRNGALLSAAIAFAEQTFGARSVLAARMDLDEKGGGIVDVFVAPEAYSKRGGRYLSSRPILN